MSFGAMWLLALCDVTWCNAMSCDVPCNGHVVCSKWFCDNVVIQSTILYYKVLLCTTKCYCVLQSTTPVLLCTTMYYSSTTLYYNVLLQYYSVLQSTTPVLLCTAKCYSSTTLYYKVLLQYYSVLQSTTPVLLCTTRYYSSTMYYKVLLQYYSVLHSTTTYYSSTTLYYKVRLCTAKYYSSSLYYKVLLQYYSVLQSATHVLLYTTKYYSSTTLYYKVLQRTTPYYSVLQSTTPVLLCTAKYYSSTTLYYKVLLQYYSVLQSTTLYYTVLQPTTPVLPCTTRYNSSTTLYYKVLLQYYSVLQSATHVLLYTTRYDPSTTLYYKVLQRTTPYYSVLLQYYSVLQSTTPVLLCTTKYYSSTTLYYKVLLQYYSVLHSTTTYYSSTTLYYKVQLQYYSVLQSTTPVLLCTTNVTGQVHQILGLPRKMNLMINPCHIWTSFTMRGATRVTLQLHQILRLPRKMNLMIDPPHIWNVIYNARSNKNHPVTSANTTPATQNDSHDWSASHMKRHLQCAEQQESASNFTKYCACHAKWISWLIPITYETLFTMRGATRVSLPLHQILRLPRKMNLMIDPHQIWNAIYNARSNTGYRPTSPNTAPATKFWAQDFSAKSLNCSRQYKDDFNTTFRAPAISQNVTKCFACHAKCISWLIRVTYETSFCMRGASQVNLEPHQRLRLPRKMNLMIDPRLIWNIISNAQRKQSQPRTSPNTAPATQNASHDWSASHMKRHLECAEQAMSTSNLSKYCACHAKWISCLIRVSYETSFPMRRASNVNPQPQQILRLPRNL